MAEKTVSEQLKGLDPNDERGTKALARAITASADGKIAELLTVLHGEDRDEAGKAAGVLLELDLSGFAALLGGAKDDPVLGLVWDVQLLGDLVAGARSRLVEKLDALYEDRRDVPLGDGPAPRDEKPLPRRVCDEAYLIERRLLSHEPEEALYLNSRLFLKLSPKERDQEIFFAKSERRFTRFDEA